MGVFTKEQQLVFTWLNCKLRLSVYADAYKGAVHSLQNKSPGYITIVSHVARDIMNGLARTVAGISSFQVQYVQHLNKLQDEWQDEWRGQGLTSLQHQEEEHVIPYDVCEMITDLIKEHKEGRRRSQEADDFFFNTFLGYSDKDKISSLEKWKDVKDFFKKKAHLREQAFSVEDQSEVAENFRILEEFLLIAATSEYSRIGTLNAILEEANS